MFPGVFAPDCCSHLTVIKILILFVAGVCAVPTQLYIDASLQIARSSCAVSTPFVDSRVGGVYLVWAWESLHSWLSSVGSG
jgi:hypothetical protein